MLLDPAPSPWPGQLKPLVVQVLKLSWDLLPSGVSQGGTSQLSGSWETTSGFSPLMFPCTSNAVLLRQEWSTSADAASLFKAPLRQLEK